VNYALVYSDDALRLVLQLRPAGRKFRLLRELERIAALPSASGDFSVVDDIGRPNQVTLIEGLLVTWWPDDAVKELRIVSIKPALRGR
jgi:hypothetical protein